ncbi:hypothetical protein KPH14_003684 [Odynerus spinipes]|uniref:Cuticle protein 6 n=1 Tax=Odynerus spinipes TaxID=1348599 RepID=A0AAD9VVE6_9HYME|nr:hypothetical protein KPH14_003684 [Odynerus spinipes]
MNVELISLLLCCLIWESSAKPTNVFLSYQDSLGQYSFGYSAPGSARSEIKTLNGGTRGAYSYVDGNGVIQTAEYVADDDGFHVIATNLPQAPLPVEETAEVSAARKEHLEALQLAEQMAEEAGNDQEGPVLSKQSVDQNDRSEKERTKVGEENRERLNSMEFVKKEEDLKMDNKALNLTEVERSPMEIHNRKKVWPSNKVTPPPSLCDKTEQVRALTPLKNDEGKEETITMNAATSTNGQQQQEKQQKQSGVKGVTFNIPLEPDENVPMDSVYPSLIRFAPPAAIHYVPYNAQ